MFRAGKPDRLAVSVLLLAFTALLAPLAPSRAEQPLYFISIEAPQTEHELMLDVVNALHWEQAASTWRVIPEKVAKNNVIDETLRVTEEQNTFNGTAVTLRNYSIPGLGKGWVTGPTLRFPASDQPRSLRLLLKNDLPCLKPPCKCASKCSEIPGTHEGHSMAGGPPGPELFNTTNLHTHGLQVSPKCPQDNVFLTLPGGCSFPVQVDIPAKHHPGTFWYHAHFHGSTAAQLASGMAGLLIIEGKMDSYLAGKGISERPFVFQRISYNEHGKLEDFSDIGLQGTGIAKTSINGVINPKIVLKAGQIERWRLLDARIEDTTPLRLVDSDNKFQDFYLIAVDGITIGPKPGKLDVLNLAPGYRADVLVQLKKPGKYELIKMSSLYGGTVQGSEPIATIEVKPDGGTPQNPEDLTLPLEGIPAPIGDAGLIKRPPVTFSVEGEDFLIDGKKYPNTPIYTAKLGTAEEWTVVNNSNMDHPFHIHVNPFQITAIKEEGKEEVQLKPGERVWRDTFLIPRKGYFKMRTRYEKFDGRFVLHCHFLNHEDLGMMATVDVQP